MKSFTPDSEQQAILNIMENTTDNIFVTGKAGSGKSEVLKYFVEHTSKEKIVLAPTGIAAINVNGQTIHSMFALDFTFIDPDKITNEQIIDKNTDALLKKTDVLIIDEISMVRADIMESVSRKFRIALGNDLPFGGVQIILFGDLYQLPPVVADEGIRQYLQVHFGGSFFFDSHAIKNSNLKIYELEHVHRQKDPEFKEMLNEVRTGNLFYELIEKFNQRCCPPPQGKESLTIATTNKIVDEVNQSKFNALNNEEFLYEAVMNGDTTQIQNQLDINLRLKVGAHVIMLRNNWYKGNLIWANGSLGVVTGLTKESIRVKIKGVEFDVEPMTWETREHKYDTTKKTINNVKIGEFTQYPIKLAWALTIHKAQGQTYDSVEVDFGRGAFLHGQAYVALSRCRYYDKLYLKQRLRPSDVIVDNSVANFIAEHRVEIPANTNEIPEQQIENEVSFNVLSKTISEKVVLISCTKYKSFSRCSAEEMYAPSNLFSASLAYARTLVSDNHIYVISAKHHLLKLSNVIDPYNETLKNRKLEEKDIWAKNVYSDLSAIYDMNNSKFTILAGQDYYQPLQPYIRNINLPLRGMPLGVRISKMQEWAEIKPLNNGAPKPIEPTPSENTTNNLCFELHQFFNNLTRYDADSIDDVPIENGIYILFEKGESYNNLDRIVRVGTHKSDDRLKKRLKDHFIMKNKDGSIFRKNIGRTFLNASNDDCLNTWEMESYDNSIIKQAVENAVSEYMRNNYTFTCIRVNNKFQRLRLEEGIIASLNKSSDFKPSPDWFGNMHPNPVIRQSGMWLIQGLDGEPLTPDELQIIKTSMDDITQHIDDKPTISYIEKPKQYKSTLKINYDNSARMKTKDITNYLQKKLTSAKDNGDKSITIKSGELHNELGLKNRLPMACSAMYKLYNENSDVIHEQPPKGNGSRLIIEYFL